MARLRVDARADSRAPQPEHRPGRRRPLRNPLEVHAAFSGHNAAVFGPAAGGLARQSQSVFRHRSVRRCGGTVHGRETRLPVVVCHRLAATAAGGLAAADGLRTGRRDSWRFAATISSTSTARLAATPNSCNAVWSIVTEPPSPRDHRPQ